MKSIMERAIALEGQDNIDNRSIREIYDRLIMIGNVNSITNLDSRKD
jgi:hypothetical protein